MSKESLRLDYEKTQPDFNVCRFSHMICHFHIKELSHLTAYFELFLRNFELIWVISGSNH